MSAPLLVPQPPTPPTPLGDEGESPFHEENHIANEQLAAHGLGLGLQGLRQPSSSSVSSFDRSQLYPMDENKLGRVDSMSSLKSTSSSFLTPNAADNTNDVAVEGSFETSRNPFGYQTTTYSVGGRSPSKSVGLPRSGVVEPGVIW